MFARGRCPSGRGRAAAAALKQRLVTERLPIAPDMINGAERQEMVAPHPVSGPASAVEPGL